VGTGSKTKSRWPLLALVVAVALVLAACQASSSEAGPTNTSLSTVGAAKSVTPPATTTPRPTTTLAAPTTTSVAQAETIPSDETTTTEPVYETDIVEISSEIRDRMSTSWREGCPVPIEDLRYVTLSHYDFEGRIQTGELIVHKDVADGIVAAFAELFEQKFPIARMELVDNYGADDNASMQANNTSAFNCRAVTGGSRWSEHAFGTALDINPLMNPYVKGNMVYPSEAAAFADRHEGIVGGIYAGDATVTALGDQGWKWGGYWSSSKDYQHFSMSGR